MFKCTCSALIAFPSSTHTIIYYGSIPIPSPFAVSVPFRRSVLSYLSSPITTPVSQAVAAPAYIEPHTITRPPHYPSSVREDVEGEARYPIPEAAHRPVNLPFRTRGVCPIPIRFRSPEDKSEAITHITTQSIRLTSPRTSSRISLAKAFTAQRIPSFTSSSSKRGRRHLADVLMVKTRGRWMRAMIFWICGGRQ
jgi:hypothetical protein